MKVTRMWMVVSIAAALAVSAAAQRSPEVALRAAMETETVKGDLKSAIEQYKKVAQSGNRAVSAQALVRMADCYQKLGDSESRKIYEQIVREYADQKEAAATARLKLGSVPSPSGELAKRLLCQECDFDEELGTGVSADGRWVAFKNRTSRDLELVDLSSRQIKRVVPKDSSGTAMTPVLSRDGREVAFAWFKEDAVHGQLRVMAADPGAKPRVVLESNPEIAYPAPLGWSADGKSILAVHRKGDLTWQLEWVSVAGGEAKALKSLQWRVHQDTVNAKLSPDGRYIVYSALAVNPKSYLDLTGSTDQHIYVLAADGSSETEVVKTSGTNRSPVWTPDGKHLLFISDRSGRPALWSVAISNGKEAGVPSLVSSSLGNGQVTPQAVTRSGSYEYLLERESLEQIFISGVDAAGRKTQERAAGESLVGTSPTWSPGGKSLAFKRRHHVNDSSIDEVSYDLVIHSLETGDEKTYPTTLGFTGSENAPWYSDGKAVLTGLGGSRPRNPGNYRVDLASGEWKELPRVPISTQAPLHHLSPEDKTLYGFGADGKIIAVDVATGTQRLLFSTHPTLLRRLQLSPDHRTLAVWYADLPELKSHLGTISVDGGNFRELLTVPARLYGGLEWTKDGQTILFTQQRGDKTHVMRIPAKGGAAEFTGLEAEGWIGWMEISPDGSRLAFSATTDPGAELWSLDNVLAALK